jgi:hypothetical protein
MLIWSVGLVGIQNEREREGASPACQQWVDLIVRLE